MLKHQDEGVELQKDGLIAMKQIEDWMNSMPDPFTSLDLPFAPLSNMPIY